MSNRYIEPSSSTEVFNKVVARLTRMGVSIWGSRELYVRGRTSGEWRSTPVNLLTVDGHQYLVAPRGVTQWVRNIRVSGGGKLRLGKHYQPFTVTELADADKPGILRPYLQRWKFEVGTFFDGVGPDASDAELLRIAPGYPAFRVQPE